MQATPRPTATPAQALEAMDSLIAAHLLGQQEMAQRLGLNITDLLCFAWVLKAGDDLLTAGELAEHAHVTTGAMTGILNRLERAGYVTRRPDPADRRRVRVAAVPSAVERAGALYGPYYARLNELFASYSADEIAVLTDWFTRTTGLAQTYIDEMREQDKD
ncbi:MarR family transcriptional regulator [Streptomyces sp. HUAS 31]|jgi:DNA-binding MarR family transcriptional regulator|uniref:MarR family winged helix-turn-helix transcriptional regulator n=1 Tax=Streptomyces TaxID=1883 RepID=UPI0023068895|nr:MULTISPECIES: MarR family transcriptional regulator [Streptomyces]WCD97995.1 MarR family transcriptional regulator [Streptomyces sp. HUAS 31]WSZ68458.1 MarR family transcriptional regulator [Streptomyces chartreusis]WTA28669.1 MarR family transcriptional regulator [Streptomyces chartreusis]WUB19157.1 MarR family transcriptional regulator [Streptomyces chartreusis]